MKSINPCATGLDHIMACVAVWPSSKASMTPIRFSLTHASECVSLMPQHSSITLLPLKLFALHRDPWPQVLALMNSGWSVTSYPVQGSSLHPRVVPFSMAICDNAKDLGEGDVLPTESYLRQPVFRENRSFSPSELNCECDMTCLHTAIWKREP